jgi:predicted RNase H-like HicB family nuclease
MSNKTVRYVVVLEQTPTSWSAYVPDLPGCIAAAATREETETLIREGIGYYLEAMAEDGEPAPEPTTATITVEVPRPTPV